MDNLCVIRGYHYFRRRIPKDLQKIFKCKEIKKALKTKDLKTASSSVRLLSHELDRVIKIIRIGILTDEQIKELVREFVEVTLNRIEWSQVRAKLYPSIQSRNIQSEHLNYEISLFKDHLAMADPSIIEHSVDSFLKEKKITPNKKSFEYKKVCIEMLKAQIEIHKVELERMHGNSDNWYDDFRSSLKQKNIIPQQQIMLRGKLLSELLSEFIELQITNNAWKSKDLREHKDFYEQFVHVIGDKDVAFYTDKDGQRAFNLLKRFPTNWKKKRELRDKSVSEIISLIEQNALEDFEVLSDTTLKKFLTWIRLLTKYAKMPDIFSNIKIKKKKKASEEREAYSKQELQKWLDSPLYTKWKPERILKNPERFWVPLFMMLCGCRPGEVCQLYKTDVKQIDGYWCIDINDVEDKSIKTLESKRIVPIHPIVINLKFLDYVKSNKDVRVFPALINYEDGEGYAELFNKWSGRYNRAHITKHPKRVPYSLRHNFTTTLSDIPHIKDSLIDEIVGHARSGETHGRYNKGYSTKTKHSAIKQLDYEIDFKHIKFPFRKK